MSEAGIVSAELSHRWHREEYEHYVEPEWCSRRLFDVEKFDGVIMDPACGFGRIITSAQNAGLKTVALDIVDRGFTGTIVSDFLNPAPRWTADNIVSNPPFDIFREFAETALASPAKKVALIWLVRTLPAARWLQETPLARILLLTPRPSMPPGHVIARGEKPGGGKQDFCWLVFDQAHKGEPTVGWLHRDGRPG